MATRAITALFDAYDDAARAVDKLEAEGIPHSDISIVASNEDDRHAARLSGEPAVSRRDPNEESDAADGAGTGATLGTVLGGGAGLLAGLGLLAIPGVGPVVAAGWLVATVTGAGVGAVTGGLLGGLTGAGLSEHEAETYAEGVRRGGTLVTVRADDAQAERVLALLDQHGSIDLDERAQNWRSQGWTGGTARPATEEIGSTAIGAAGSTTTGLDTESGHTLFPADEGRVPGTSPAREASPGVSGGPKQTLDPTGR
ncbi:general stress protein [Methylobacterium planeticum]|uniref:general stress protein n=1 Tax=Methylobacterium planeticum TaxID=2615211 RepID=UPI001FED3C72|nr:general stress protein [Methylobacterium planeticum]